MSAVAVRADAAVARLSRTSPAGDLSWQPRGLCTDDRDWHDLSQLDQKRICGNCPVHTECLNYALQHATGDPAVWGGYNGWQRARMLGKRFRKQAA